jgi:hypothetical protein
MEKYRALHAALRDVTTGPLNQLIVNLGGQDGVQWEQQLKQFLRKEPCWSNGQAVRVAEPKPAPPLLEFVSTVMVDVTTGRLFAKEGFAGGTEGDALMKIKYFDSFERWFLIGDSKIEDSISEQTLCYHTLQRGCKDGEIITELGGEAKAETTLSEMLSLLEKQKYGEDGVLEIRHRRNNIFFIKDFAGVLRVVNMQWNNGNWYVDARPIDSPGRWYVGNQVFSRNSVLESSEFSAPAQA